LGIGDWVKVMTQKISLDKLTPITQSVNSVVELLNYMGKTSNPLPESVELPGMLLVLSGKRDSYYTVSSESCSCPSNNFYRGGPCKHQRRYFPKNNSSRQSLAESIDQANENLKRMPKRYQAMVSSAREAAEDDPDSIKPTGKWPGGFNGPVDLDEIKANAAPNERGA
jgi:hypothetical protein